MTVKNKYPAILVSEISRLLVNLRKCMSKDYSEGDMMRLIKMDVIDDVRDTLKLRRRSRGSGEVAAILIVGALLIFTALVSSVCENIAYKRGYNRGISNLEPDKAYKSGYMDAVEDIRGEVNRLNQDFLTLKQDYVGLQSACNLK